MKHVKPALSGLFPADQARLVHHCNALTEAIEELQGMMKYHYHEEGGEWPKMDGKTIAKDDDRTYTIQDLFDLAREWDQETRSHISGSPEIPELYFINWIKSKGQE